MTFFVNIKINFDTLDHELKLLKTVYGHLRNTDPLHTLSTNTAIEEA